MMKWRLLRFKAILLLLLFMFSAIGIPVVAYEKRSHIFSAQETYSQIPDNSVQALLDDERNVREQALETLKKYGLDTTVSLLEQALDDEDWQMRVIAAYHLGELGIDASQSVPVLIELLEDINADVRFSVAQALGKINSEEAIPALIETLQDEDKNVQFAVTDALLKLSEKIKSTTQQSRFHAFLTNHLGTKNHLSLPYSSTSTPTLLLSLRAESRWSIPILVNALGNGNWFIRNRAASKLETLQLESLATSRSIFSAGNATDGFVRSVFANTFWKTNLNHLIQILHDKTDDNFRASAAYTLGLIDSEASVSALVQTLNDEQDNVRLRAALALRKLDIQDSNSLLLEEAIPILLSQQQTISDEFSVWSETLIRFLEKDDLANALRIVAEFIPDRESSFIAAALPLKIIQEEISEEEAIPLLLNVLQSKNLDAIGRLIFPAEMVSKDAKYWNVLSNAFKQLGISKTFLILKPILLQEGFQALPPVQERQAAAKILSFFGNDAVRVISESLTDVEAFSVFIEVLNGEEDPVVINLAQNILNQVSSEIISKLISILQDETENSFNQYSAVEALGILKAEEAIPALTAALNRESSLTVNILIALGEIGATEAVSEIVKQLESNQQSIRWWAAISLGWIKSEQAIPNLLKVLEKDSVSAVREHAAEALGNIGSLQAESGLISALKDNESLVRASAVEALGKIHSQSSIPTLIEMMRDQSWIVRQKAAHALSSLAPESIPLLITSLDSHQSYPLAIRHALRDKDADYRRSLAYVFWLIARNTLTVDSKLTELITNEEENIFVRWMAAAALQETGNDIEYFFSSNNLTNPEELSSYTCPNDLYDPKWETADHDFSEEYMVKRDELIYAGRCIYGEIPQAGGSIYGLYDQIKALLSRI